MTSRGRQDFDYQSILPLLEKISIFGGLTVEQQKSLTRQFVAKSFIKGDTIFRQGEACGHIHVIYKGSVEIFIESEGRQMNLVVFNAGDCFGETSVLGIQPHSANARALEDTTCMILERKALLRIYETDPVLFGLLILNIARETSRRLYHADQMLIQTYGSQKSHRYKS